jgi:ribose transport system substrate-binding protein
MKKFGLVLVCLALVVSGVFAGGNKDAPASGGGAASSATKTLYIPLVSKGFQHQFWQAVRQGAEQAAKQYGVTITFEGPESESQVDKQMEMYQTALGKKPDAIGLAALDSQAYIPLVRAAKDQGIPVITFDATVASDDPVSFVATNSLAAGAVAADKMAAAIGEKGKVAIICHDQTNTTGIERRDGFINQVKAKYPNITLLETQYGGGDPLRSTEICKTVINANNHRQQSPPTKTSSVTMPRTRVRQSV